MKLLTRTLCNTMVISCRPPDGLGACLLYGRVPGTNPHFSRKPLKDEIERHPQGVPGIVTEVISVSWINAGRWYRDCHLSLQVKKPRLRDSPLQGSTMRKWQIKPVGLTPIKAASKPSCCIHPSPSLSPTLPCRRGSWPES